MKVDFNINYYLYKRIKYKNNQQTNIQQLIQNNKLNNDTTLHYQTLIDIREENNIQWNDDELEKQYEELMDQLLNAATNNTTN